MSLQGVKFPKIRVLNIAYIFGKIQFFLFLQKIFLFIDYELFYSTVNADILIGKGQP